MTNIASVGILTIDTSPNSASNTDDNLDELLIITNCSLQQICHPKETSNKFHALTDISELQKCKPKPPELYYAWNNIKESILDGNTFSTLANLLLSNDAYRKSFLAQMIYQSPSLNCGTEVLPCMKVRLIMPKKSQIGYKS